ncbi:recombinase family protein [Streptomyces sp. NP-1717]|uniref:recombinase family protein n=1 Tax=Streptomyces sp. NP-1717 TaxID=2704470 RepID=UPI001F5CAEE2|nr:recombinase family protein [Streptomyces sp. NP-1717]MCI3225588.1 recombinase family protein [Streptomyces sp. NP-1717]
MANNKAKQQAITPGEEAAIYCRISHVDDDDQTGVDRQERICREIAERLRLLVPASNIFVDNNRSAWRRDRKRPGWDAMLKEMEEGGIRHLIAYHPDRLMRQPRDLEELLSISDSNHITLHGEANRRDLTDPDDRFILRIEVAHACRSSDDTSRRLKDAMDDRANAGTPHTGRRRYGYTKNGMEIIEAEAEIVREVFRRFLAGQSPRAIARDLNEREITTALGKTWGPDTVRALIDSRHVAGIRMFRGEEHGVGNWPAIIDRGQWDEAQEKRKFRAERSAEKNKPTRYYLLRSVVMCTCGRTMAGSSGSVPEYRCTRRMAVDGTACKRTIAAEPLERFARAVAVQVLSKLDISGRAPAATTRPPTDVEADEKDAQKLKDLYEMWDADEMPTREYRQKRREIEARMKERQKQTVVRPVAVLEGITGPGAEESWKRLEVDGDYARMNAIYRFLFGGIVIGPASGVGNFDTDRITIKPNGLD